MAPKQPKEWESTTVRGLRWHLAQVASSSLRKAPTRLKRILTGGPSRLSSTAATTGDLTGARLLRLALRHSPSQYLSSSCTQPGSAPYSLAVSTAGERGARNPAGDSFTECPPRCSPRPGLPPHARIRAQDAHTGPWSRSPDGPAAVRSSAGSPRAPTPCSRTSV